MQPYGAIPTGRKALVTHRSGKVETITGPQKVFVGFGTTVELFEQHVIPEREAYALQTETGAITMVTGPAVVDIHPRGALKRLQSIALAPHEAVVVRQTNGERVIYVGMGYPVQDDDQKPKIVQTPLVQLEPGETLHEFKWTGSKGDTEEKSPGSLRITQLRLQQTQSWFQVVARTKDNIVLQFNLMVFFDYIDVRALLVNDDPLGVMFNRINGALLNAVGAMNFDQFRKEPAKIIEEAARFAASDEDSKALAEMGLEVSNAVLRLWKPIDPSIERLMAEEGTTIAKQAVAEAQHQARLAAIKAETAELMAAKKNNKLKKETYQAEGQREAARLTAMFDELKDKLGEDGARRVISLATLTGAATEGRLTITTEALAGKV